MKGLIETPPVGPPGERLITLGVLVLFAVHLSFQRAPPYWLIGIFFLLTLTALYLRAVQSFHLSFFFTLWVALPLITPVLSQWPLDKVTPLVAYGVVVGVSQRLRKSVLWIRPGRLGVDIWLLVALIVVVSSGALLAWKAAIKPDLGPCRANIPAMPFYLMPLAGVAFALINSAVEEAIFRGVLLQALDSAVGPGIIPLVIQAVFFGWMHYSEGGCPKGLSGVAMASVYGLFLGYLRYRSRGMLAPWLAHAGTDVGVFIMVATSAG